MSEHILISGATGFIAGHTIEQLLAQGYTVTGTVRDPNAAEKNTHLHAMAGAGERLTLVAADLNDSDPFSAYADVDIIMHMASPYTMTVDDPQRDLVDPAVNGTLSMLRAAAVNPRVRRVVLTSSSAAITDQPDGHLLNEEDWNIKSSLTRNPYYYSKVKAERAAWVFMEREKPSFDLVVINPFFVLGPCHTACVNSSNQVLVDLINGQYPAVMALEWYFVDVRDVARSHIAAMHSPKASGRYICSSGKLTMAELVTLIRDNGYAHTKIPKMSLSGGFGTGLMKLASYFQPTGVGSYLRTHLGGKLRIDNAKIKRDLGIEFLLERQSLLDTLADLSKWGHIPKPCRVG